MILPAKAFYMIRHGETEANKAQVMAGQTDSPLTETGKQQADLAGQPIQKLEIKPRAIVHSDLSRARDTAAAINTYISVDMHQDADLGEISPQ